ncbi:MAG: hypothetical protein PWR01_2039 [Clostridiales bacterium]|nr:hypothetical protein [Clostridiales bacterium]MDN5280966.1 hypothetical protein [Candidatus Ozemobacter sp.]
MKHKISASLLVLILATAPAFSQQGNQAFPSSAFGNQQNQFPQAGGDNSNQQNQPQQSPAAQFIDSAKKLMGQGNYAQSKEALKTAIRVEPMNFEAWSLYDETVIADYIQQRRKEKLAPVIERDISPLFEITRVDTYIELDTLYVVGSLKNLSDKLKQKIRVTAKILDDSKKELRRQTGELNLTKRGLLPNESSLFEIPFKNPPAGAKSFRVEVTGFE